MRRREREYKAGDTLRRPAGREQVTKEFNISSQDIKNPLLANLESGPRMGLQICR